MTRVEAVPARSALGRREVAPAYNLFRRAGKPDLYCAVPEDHAVPTFLRGIIGPSWAGSPKQRVSPAFEVR